MIGWLQPLLCQTQCAADLGYVPRFLAFFVALSFFRFEGKSTHQPVTRAVSSLYSLQDVAFEWDSKKAIANFRKHKIKFELAAEAFFDPFVCYLDEQIVGSEPRERLVGLTKTWQLLLVVYVMRGDVIRSEE